MAIKLKLKPKYVLLLFNKISLQGSNLLNYMNKNGSSISYLYGSILSVICEHDYIKKDDIKDFESNISDLSNSNSFLFSLKASKDANGLYHLISISNSHLRDADIFNCYEKMVEKPSDCKKLVLLCDIGITGTELEKALKFYLKNEFKYKDGEDKEIGRNRILNEQCYFKFDPENSDNWNKFNQNFTSFNKVIICAAIITENGIARQIYKSQLATMVKGG